MDSTTFQFIPFPDPEQSDKNGLVASGGDLSPEMILSAYMQGLFPWFNEGYPILWWSPDPRMILYPNELKVSNSLRQKMKNTDYKVTFDQDFYAVINNCARIPRKNQKGTWITSDMIEAYYQMHKLGFAHSVEICNNGKLVGGLYGLGIGRMFFGESMFHLERDASKIALYHLCQKLIGMKITVVDVQQSTTHLKSLGAIDIPRKQFLAIINDFVFNSPNIQNWNIV